MTLRRIDRTYRGKPTHHYELDGARVDGVTTVISQGIPKPALTYWSARTVAEYAAANLEQLQTMLATGGIRPTVDFLKGVPWEQRDTAAVRGTEVHALAEQVVQGLPTVVPPELVGHVDGYARWLDRSGVDWLMTEFVCASRRWRYAGTGDLILTDHLGVPRVADIKTSSGVYPETALQLAAYRHAEFYLDADDERPMPETDDTGWVIHVTATGTEAYPLPVGQSQFKAFLHAQAVARWAKTSKDLVGPPVRFGDDDGEDAA